MSVVCVRSVVTWRMAALCYLCWQPEEEEDEETREYRKKIEQQKQEREKFLQRKEERRKLAALQKQRELQRKDVDIQTGGTNQANALVALEGMVMNHFISCTNNF